MTGRPEISCTLVGDGPTDRVLEYPIRWLLWSLCPTIAVQFEWADFRSLPNPPRTLTARIHTALLLYPAQVLFVHRDAERNTRAERVAEIERAAGEIEDGDGPQLVCVVPVRMTEAWLLLDEDAIRSAAGNPNGTVALSLPRPRVIEHEPDPKSVLRNLLLDASESTGRRRRSFLTNSAFYRLAQLITNYAPLRDLAAFRTFEEDLRSKLADGGWMPRIAE